MLEGASTRDVEKIRAITERRVRDITVVPHASGLRRHFVYQRLFRAVIKRIEPDIVLDIDDQYPADLYFLRAAKQRGCATICFQVGMTEAATWDQRRMFAGAQAARLARSLQIPQLISRAMLFGWQTIRHIWHYVVAPALVGEHPFWGSSSACLHVGSTGMRDADALLVFSERDKTLHLVSGTRCPIHIIPHPLTWPSSDRLRTCLFQTDSKSANPKRRQLTIFLTQTINEFAIAREDHSVITRETIYRNWLALIKVAAAKFPNHLISLKPHPASRPDDSFLQYLGVAIAAIPAVQFSASGEDSLSLIAHSEIIIAGFSTILLVASLAFPDKIVVSVDLERRLAGDVFKTDPNVLYFDDLDVFRKAALLHNSRRHITTDGDLQLLAFISQTAHKQASRSMALR